ncbi:hypothetical protein SNE40_014599 [Patella caerulea]|uniref:Armadillo repeat-containing protein 1 n=1 Tax=Patella caerulea TaxID=87958 RepID=A0AAN8PQT0_PATCE
MDANAIKMVQTMASDSRKRLLIIKDSTCMSGLVSLLSNTDEDTISVVLETLMMLGKSAEEIKWLGCTPGLIKSLKTIMKSSEEKNSVRVKAEEFYNVLCNGRKDTRTPLRDSNNRKHNDKDDKNSFKNKNSPGYHAKAVVLLIKGITNKCDADLCIKLLVEVKGVISITFDMESKRCIVRTKSSVKPETLVKAISNSQTFIAQQVIKHENGKETLQSFGMVQPSAEKENLSEPEYLPDDIDSPVASSKAVARGGTYPKQENNWFSSAASFLSNSFYW